VQFFEKTIKMISLFVRNNGKFAALTRKMSSQVSPTAHNGRLNATVGIWVDAGSRYETPKTNGVASLFDHLFYSGTTKRGAKEMQNELEESDGDYRRLVFDNLHATAFQGTPLALSPLGTTKSIQELTSKSVQRFQEDNFKPIRMVLTGIGGVDHEQLDKLAKKYFGDLTNEYSERISNKEPCRFTGSEFHFRDDDIPYTLENDGYEHHRYPPDGTIKFCITIVVGLTAFCVLVGYDDPPRKFLYSLLGLYFILIA